MEVQITNLKELPLLERPREKLLRKGAGSLSNTELIAILFGSGSKNLPLMSICRELIAAIDNDARRLSAMDSEKLCSIKGIGEVKAIILLAALELGRRAVADQKPLILKQDKEVEQFISAYFTGEGVQYLLILLNHRHELLATNELTPEKNQIPQLKAIIKLCLEAGAAGCVICRNDCKLPEEILNQEKAFIIQLDAAASMLKIKMRGLLIIEKDPK